MTASPPWRLRIEPAACGEGYAALLYPPRGAGYLYGVWAESAVVAQVDASAWLRRRLFLAPTTALPVVLEKQGG